MSALSPTHVLAKYAHALQVAAPQEWEIFVQCFEAYTADVTVAVTIAEQNAVLNAQGRAQAFRHLLETFRNCHVVPATKPPSP